MTALLWGLVAFLILGFAAGARRAPLATPVLAQGGDGDWNGSRQSPRHGQKPEKSATLDLPNMSTRL
jgi:hypothetical protein